jgi:hypothetical protein
MAARSQPCASWISGTNCVHEYWMFDAATMQATPKASWFQRDESTGAAEVLAVGIEAIQYPTGAGKGRKS